MPSANLLFLAALLAADSNLAMRLVSIVDAEGANVVPFALQPRYATQSGYNAEFKTFTAVASNGTYDATQRTVKLVFKNGMPQDERTYKAGWGEQAAKPGWVDVSFTGPTRDGKVGFWDATGGSVAASRIGKEWRFDLDVKVARTENPLNGEGNPAAGSFRLVGSFKLDR